MIQHANMNDDAAVLIPRMALELYAHPTMAFVGALKVACRHGICESKESCAAAACRLQPLHIQLMLVIEHALEALPGYVALTPAINRITDGHVIRRHRLGNCAGSPAHLEEPACHLLSSADLGKRAVPQRIKVDLQRLLVRAQLRVSVCTLSLDTVWPC